MAQDLDLKLPKIEVSNPPTQEELQAIADQVQTIQISINNILDRLRLEKIIV